MASHGDSSSKAGGGSLAQWKVGANKMTTAEAGNHVAAVAPPKPRPKAPKPTKPIQDAKPWHEQSVAERYGAHPPKLLPVPITQQLRYALRHLEMYQDKECTWEELTTHGIPPWYDTREGGDLYNALIENPAVVATSTGFMYRSQYGIRNKASLLQHIQATPTGVTSVDIKDSYTNVLEDADKLHAEGLVYKLYNGEFKVDVFFAVPRQRFHLEHDLLDTYLKTDLPADLGKLADDVTGMGMRSALAHAKNDRRPLSMLKQEKTKKKRKLNLRHMTNTHLAHLLTDAQYTSID